MHLVALHDRARIEAFCRRNAEQYVYELGDLDPYFWPHTQWFALEHAGELQELALLYFGTAQPTLLVHTQTGAAGAHALADALAPLLPVRLHAHLDTAFAQAIARHARVSDRAGFFQMALRRPSALPPPGDVARLGPGDAREVAQFYAAAYPDNWFMPRMLETGCYFAAHTQGRIAAIAGVHVVSRGSGAAALGNIAVLPDLRGRGLAQTVTAAVCRHLLEQGIHTIGLNVSAENRPAMAAYQRLGFEVVSEFFECYCAVGQAR